MWWVCCVIFLSLFDSVSPLAEFHGFRVYILSMEPTRVQALGAQSSQHGLLQSTINLLRVGQGFSLHMFLTGSLDLGTAGLQ